MSWKSIWSDQRGNSFIEMSLVAPILTVLLVGMVDISRAISTKLQLEQAAQRAIELVQRTTYSTSMNSTARWAACSSWSFVEIARLECNNSSTALNYDTGTCSSGQIYARYVRVSVTKSFSPLFGTRFFPGANANGTVTLTGYAFVRTQ
jgi:hypothetical protein